MSKVTNLMLHNNRGYTLPDKDFLVNVENWHIKHPEEGSIFGPITKYTWEIDGVMYERRNVGHDQLCLLPDAQGFIAFESNRQPNNCLLLDAYGNERMRLAVPRYLTGGLVEPSYETGEGTFLGVSEPYTNPRTGIEGSFGVEGYVEWGRFYFELDYHTGEFLWCRQIRD